MSVFEDGGHALEAKFAHDEDRQLLALARGNRLFAIWASDRMQLPSNQAEAYIQAAIQTGLQSEDDQAVVEKIKDDFRQAGLDVSNREIHEVFATKGVEALKQLRFEDLSNPEFTPELS